MCESTFTVECHSLFNFVRVSCVVVSENFCEGLGVIRVQLRECVEVSSCVYFLSTVTGHYLLVRYTYRFGWRYEGVAFFLGVFGDVYPKLSAMDSSCELMPTLECGSLSDVI